MMNVVKVAAKASSFDLVNLDIHTMHQDKLERVLMTPALVCIQAHHGCQPR